MSKTEYMKAYQKERYVKNKAEAAALLGGVCVKCGASENLQFDHIDPATKVKNVTLMFNPLAWRDEIKKCQLLCPPCHTDKTIVDLNRTKAVGTHGTLSSYRHCKCDLCKAAKQAHNREYHKKRVEAKRSEAKGV